MTAAAFVILASPPVPISTMGGMIVPDCLKSTVGAENCGDGILRICRFLDTAVTMPPPMTAPAAKYAA